MSELVEGELLIRLPASATGRKFDDASHPFINVMKAVDFIVEEPDRNLFVECKDPDQTGATEERRSTSLLLRLFGPRIRQTPRAFAHINWQDASAEAGRCT